MANEITACERRNTSLMLFFVYLISSPRQVGGQNVVPTPATGTDSVGNPVSLLPSIVQKVISQAEIDALDAGVAAWETVSFRLIEGATGAELATEARRIYASKKSVFELTYAERYQYAGIRINA